MAEATPPPDPNAPVGEASPIAFGPTVTIFFSDIRGFTEYTDAHGDAQSYRMLQHHNGLVQEQLALYHGHIVKTLGDSYMVSFDSARNAVACAIGIQKQLSAYNGTQQGPKIEIGIGINTGEPIREGDDLFGGSVNLASRICAVAGSGRILVSETVRQVVGRIEGADYIDRGYFEIKGFQDPQHLFEVDWSGVGAVRATQVAPPRPVGVAATTSGPIPAAGSAPAPGARPKGLLIGGAVAALVVAALIGAFFVSRGTSQPPPVPTAAAPPAVPKEGPLVKAKELLPTAAAVAATRAAGAEGPKPGAEGATPPPGGAPQAKIAPGVGAAPSPAIAGAAGPGRLIFSDDFADPTKGQFRDKLVNTVRATLPNGAAVQYPWEAGYIDGGYVTRIKGPYPDNPQRVPFLVNIDSANRVQGDFAVEVTARTLKSSAEVRYGLICDLGPDNFLVFAMNANDGTYVAATGNRGDIRRSLTSGRASSVRPANQDNVMRLEVRGEALRLFVNGQELAPARLPSRSREASLLGLQFGMLGPLADGDLEVRFDDYKVFALGQ